MIVTELYNGQGLGNQLWCYAVTRVIAESLNYDFGISGIKKFKGREFINIDFGKKVIGGSGPEGGPPNELPESITNYYKERMSWHKQYHNIDVTGPDEQLLNIADNTKIDGCMQAYSYIKNNKQKIKSWFNINTPDDYNIFNNENICIIHIRGGDVRNHHTMVGQKYYSDAINHFKNKNPNIEFYAITDDPHTAIKMLSGVKIIGSSTVNVEDNVKANHHIGGPVSIDFNIILKCKNLIMPASSFSWWAAWLNDDCKTVIAPKYWAAFNLNAGFWSCADMQVENWLYLDKDGAVS